MPERPFDSPGETVIASVHATPPSELLAARGKLGKATLLIAVVQSIGLGGVWSCGGIDGGSVPIDRVLVRVRAQDTAWSATYVVPLGAGKTLEVPTGREVHVPLGADVELQLESRDYICIFAMPTLGVRDFAAPGLPTKVHFQAKALGSYPFRGDEMCSQPHGEKTRGRFLVEAPAAFQSWVHEQSKKADR